MASSFMPSMKCVQMRSFAEPEEKNCREVGKGNREGKQHKSQHTTEFLEPLSATTPFPLTIGHERCDDPQLVVCNKGGSVRQDVGMVEEFRDMKLPLQAMVS